jgi:hypothetical protein
MTAGCLLLLLLQVTRLCTQQGMMQTPLLANNPYLHE